MANKSLGVNGPMSQPSSISESFALPVIMSSSRVRRAKREAQKLQVVYFMEGRGDGLIKIGRSGCIKDRMANLERELGIGIGSLSVRGYVSATRDDCVKLETALHKHFAHLRKDGEWFSLDDENLMHAVIGVSDQTIGKSYTLHGLAFEETPEAHVDQYNPTGRDAAWMRKYRALR